MTVLDILKLNENLIVTMKEHNIAVSEVDNIKMVSEFNKMRSEGVKCAYIVATLSEYYGIDPRSVYRVAKRLNRVIP